MNKVVKSMVAIVLMVGGTGCGLIVSDESTKKNEQIQAVCPRSMLVKWDASTSPNVAGYNIYYGNTAGGPYPIKIDAGNVTEHRILNVCPGTYYLVATAYRENLESVYSTEANAQVTADAPVAAEAPPLSISREMKVIVP